MVGRVEGLTMSGLAAKETDMKRESLVNVRTVREIVSSLDRSRVQPPLKTTNLLSRGGMETQPMVNPAVVANALDKERRRFQRRMESLGRSQTKMLGARQKLADTKEKNRRVMALRLDLYKQYWRDTAPEKTRLVGSHQGQSSTQQIAGSRPQPLRVKQKHKTFRYGGRSYAES